MFDFSDGFIAGHGSPDSNMRALFMSMPLPIVIMEGREGLYTFANESALKIFGPRKFLGLTMRQAFPDMNENIFKLAEDVFDSGISFSTVAFPIHINWNDKSDPYTKYFTFIYSPYTSNEGEIIGVVSIAQDITEHILMQRKLEETQIVLDNICKRSPVSFWITNNNNETIFGSDAWAKWTGCSIEDSTGIKWKQFLHHEDSEIFYQNFLDATSSRKTFEAEFRLNCADGIIRKCFSKGEPWYLPNGEYGGYSGYTIDISDK
jgi:PAS domain S-box-containing protein